MLIATLTVNSVHSTGRHSRLQLAREMALAWGKVAGRVLSIATWLALLAGASFACTGGSARQAGHQANALLAEGRTDEALAAYREGRHQWPTMGFFPYGEGLALYRLDRYEEAEAPLREATRLSPAAAEHHLYLGHVLRG